MSEDRKRDYEVGYRKPPLHSRFKPGQSANPAGRKKGVANFKTDVENTLHLPVRLSEAGRPNAFPPSKPPFRDSSKGPLAAMDERLIGRSNWPASSMMRRKAQGWLARWTLWIMRFSRLLSKRF